MKHNKATKYDHYGLAVYYRFEGRKPGRTISLSLRKTDGTRQPRVYLEKNIQISPKWADRPDEEILQKYLPKYFRKIFPPPPIDGNEIEPSQAAKRELFSQLPLAVLWEVDRLPMKKSFEWSNATLNEYSIGFCWLIKYFGDRPLTDLTPKLVAPELVKADNEHKQKIIYRALKMIYLFETEAGNVLENPWEDYQLQPGRKKFRKEELNRENIAEVMLPNETVGKILSICKERLLTKDGPQYFAVMLRMTVPLSWDEICPLRLQDFRTSDYYGNFRIVTVKEECVKARNTYRRQPIIDPPRIRNVPLAQDISQEFERLIACESFRDAYASDTAFLLFDRKNRARCLTPKAMDAFLLTHFSNELNINRKKGFRKMDAARLINTTVRNHLTKAAIECEEIRYLEGKAPQSTAAKHYCDYGNEAELFLISESIECLHGRLSTGNAPSPVHTHFTPMRQGAAFSSPSAPGYRASEVHILQITPLSPDVVQHGVDLLLSSNHGQDITAELLHNDSERNLIT